MHFNNPNFWTSVPSGHPRHGGATAAKNKDPVHSPKRAASSGSEDGGGDGGGGGDDDDDDE